MGGPSWKNIRALPNEKHIISAMASSTLSVFHVSGKCLDLTSSLHDWCCCLLRRNIHQDWKKEEKFSSLLALHRRGTVRMKVDQWKPLFPKMETNGIMEVREVLLINHNNDHVDGKSLSLRFEENLLIYPYRNIFILQIIIY